MYYGYGEEALVDSLVGKVVTGVTSDEVTITFSTKDGEDVVWEVDADCCSCTWIENADLELVRGMVTKVRENGLPDSHYELFPQVEKDSLQCYGITIESEQGSGTVDFRNESNGYYGGSMRVVSPVSGYDQYGYKA